MSEKDLYQQKKQAQLDEWKAELEKLKAKAEGASGDAKLKLNRQIDAIEKEIEKGESTLESLASAGEGAWSAVKENVENAWGSLKSAFGEKDLYQQKKQAQLDEWKAELKKLKAKAEGASADSKIEINKQIESIEKEIKEGAEILSKFAEDSE